MPKYAANAMYHEEQSFRQIWVWIIVICAVAISWYTLFGEMLSAREMAELQKPAAWSCILWVAVGIVLPVLFYLAELVTEVTPDGVRLQFYPLFTRYIPAHKISGFEMLKYRPVIEYGGWGIRWSLKNGVAYTVSGNAGVRLQLENGKKLLIGSQNPRALLMAISEMAHKSDD